MDELNIIISLYAKSSGVSKVITKVAHTEKDNILDNLEIGSVVCPKELCCNSIVRYVRALEAQTGAAISVHSIVNGQVEALEFMVDEYTKYCDTPLKEINVRKNVLIVCITHAGKTMIPDGESKFQVGDTVIVVATGEVVIHQLNDIFE